MSGFTNPKASNFNIGTGNRIQEFISKNGASQLDADINMNLNYSGGGIGTTTYKYIASGEYIHVIHRVIIQISDGGQMAFDKFGKNTTLSIGVSAVQGTTTPPTEVDTGQIIKLNTDWAKHMADVSILEYSAGKQQMYISWDLVGQGTPATLDGPSGEFFGVRLEEDMSDVESFTLFVHGQRTSKAGL